MMIKFSLVIATYNRAEQLMITLRSVAAQTADKAIWECIVVDNNSTDHTRSNIEQFIADNPSQNIKYCLEKQQGLSHARNAGINNALGDIIAFIDDDEHIVPEFIDSYIELFDRIPQAMSAGGKIIAEYPGGRPVWMSKYSEEPIANPMDFGDEIKPFPKGRIPGGGNMAMRKTVFEEIGVFDTTLGRTGKKLSGGEESDLFERIKSKGMECYYVPKAVMYHIIPESKLNRDYFARLAFNNGIGQWTRATLHNHRFRLVCKECCKWIATLLLCLTHKPTQSKYLIIMRWNISKGIINAARS
jgi:glycosyltransferase involved in cell wall biosynthesis